MTIPASSELASDAVLARLLTLHPKLIDLSLGRMEGLLERLGNPHRRLPPVIHVAGTNGKGSTCAFLRAMLEAEGKRVHVYSSPHLVRFHERIRIGGRLIDEDELAALLEGEAATAFAALDKTNRYAFCHRVASAVKAETRRARAQKVVEQLLAGALPYPPKR